MYAESIFPERYGSSEKRLLSLSDDVPQITLPLGELTAFTPRALASFAITSATYAPVFRSHVLAMFRGEGKRVVGAP